MAALLKVLDEHFGPGGAERRPAADLRLVSERTTAREIIRRRVDAEVQAFNAERPDVALKSRSLLIEIEPGSAEASLNPLKAFHRVRQASPERELARAVAAFEKQRFIMLFDDRQVEGLDEPLTVTADSQVVFLYLTPLKGG